MPMYLNHRSILQCTHGGRVVLFPPPFRSWNIMNSHGLTDQDLLKAIIVGCGQMGPGVKPCTKIIQIMVGKAGKIVVDGEIPILDNLQALTDGGPPGIVTALDNGQSNATITPMLAQIAALQAAARSGTPFCET